MAIKDLFPACPICLRIGAVRTIHGRDQCRACGARFRRGRGARIIATTATGDVERDAVDWLARLPATANGHPANLGPERARVRVALGIAPLRRRGELLGWVERFGPASQGTITLDEERLAFRADARAIQWPIERITAVQPSSAALQIKARGQPVASIRFLETSVRMWEDAIQSAVRALWLREGRGTIAEFQPCIRAR